MIKTHYCKINDLKKDKDCLIKGASILRWGGTVVFPTETVYGLGANAFNPEAVAKIFRAKKRPADNPLIVHIAKFAELEKLTAEMTPLAEYLAHLFWPGPLALILKKNKEISPLVTGGLDTIAIRMPAHPVALALIEKAKVPIAAPSANLSGKPSPTRGIDALKDLAGRVDLVIDGGPCLVGLESTVLDLTVNPPMILRPGGIDKEALETAIGPVDLEPCLQEEINSGDLQPRSPGMKYKHYAPKAEIIVIQGLTGETMEEFSLKIKKEKELGKKVGLILTEETALAYNSLPKEIRILPDSLQVLGSQSDQEIIASRLFTSFRAADQQQLDIVFAEEIPATGLGLAIMNRLIKAASYRRIQL